ncbi:hypothetical protein SK128_017355 [Halocaridina rubra]|uniref:Uncharacterized protein n=1 Tax=Halocaridina rubra TaxID=373956 RepID=A0AAN9AFI5_HALRR
MHKIQKSQCNSPESLTVASSPDTNSQEKRGKSIIFSLELDNANALEESEIFVRGVVSEYDSLNSVVYLSNGSSLKVEIPKETLYIMGRKMDESKKFASVIAVGSTVKALVKRKGFEDEAKEGEKDSNVTYTAVIAWFGEIPDMKGLKSVVSELDGEVCQDVNMGIENESENLKSIDNDNRRNNSKMSSTELAHIHGYIWWANKKEGILRIYEEKGWGSSFSGIIFDINSVHFEGRKASCDALHFLVAHFNDCYVQAKKITPIKVHGMLIKWEAVHIDFGVIPRSLTGDGPHQCPLSKFKHDEQKDVSNPSTETSLTNTIEKSSVNSADTQSFKLETSIENKTASIINGIDSSNESMEDEKLDLKHCSISDFSEESFDPFGDCENWILFPNEEYGGKHLTGHLVQLCFDKGVGIAMWKSMDYGDVYIMFKHSVLYVDLISMNKVMQLPESVYSRRCNLYVLPVKAKMVFGFKVQLMATCGWLGAKPLCIPMPGRQPKAKSLLYLQTVCKSAENNRSTIQHKKAPFNDFYPSYLEKNESQSANNMKADGKHMKKELKSKPLMSEGTADQEPTIKTDDTKNENYRSGEVMEIHCNMGKLVSDGKSYYFSRDQCYLYGIRLSLVELWHVLILGQKVLFKLSNYSKSLTKVEKVLIEDKVISSSNHEEIEEYVMDWCTNSAVPDCTRQILVKQLKNSSSDI